MDAISFRDASDELRDELIAQRKDTLSKVQEPLVGSLRAAGVSEISPLWLINHLVVRVPAGQVASLSAISGVSELILDDEHLESLAAYGGDTTRAATSDATMLAAGIDGSAGSRTGAGNKIRLGILEYNNFINTHVAFQTVFSSRIAAAYSCTATSCTSALPVYTITHGSYVTWVAAGSIEANQSTAFPGYNTFAQQQHSGMSPQSSIYYYAQSSCDAAAFAVQKAVADGVDVLNMSFGGASCAGLSYKCGSFDDALEAASNAGVVAVGAAGNAGCTFGTACNMSAPMYRTSVISVNGLDTQNDGFDYAVTPMAVGTGLPGPACATGGVPIRTWNGNSVTMSGIGVSAPAVLTHAAATPADTYVEPGAFIYGTSMASPVIAGGLANLRQAITGMGWTGNDARLVRAIAYIGTDAWEPSGTTMTSGLSSVSGHGRARFKWPSSTSLTGPWGWGWSAFWVQQGQTVAYSVNGGTPIGASITQTKWSITWSEPDLNNVADIDIAIWNTCPVGGGPPQWVAGQFDFDLRNRIQLRAPTVTGMCLEMRVTGFSVPPANRVVFSTDMIHSGTPF